jgi:hypothetical protein
VIFAPNFVYFNRKMPLPAQWRDIDVFVYQPIENPPSPEYSDEYVLSEIVNPSATKLRVPYIMWTGLCPWHYDKAWPGLGTDYGNKWIDDNLGSISSGEIAALDTTEQVDMREIEGNAQWSLDLFCKKESRTDVTGIGSFLVDNYRDRDLFWTPNHPKGNLALAYCRAIWHALGLGPIPDRMEAPLDAVLNGEKTPVFPSVAAALGLRYAPGPYFFNDRVSRSAADYVDEYVKRRLALNKAAA